VNVPAQADRVYPETRVAVALIVVVLAGGFVLLYLWPGNTEQLWAWTIRPEMTPLLMGGGYASGVYFFGRAVFARRWHWVALGFLPVALFTWIEGLATVLHWDRFNHSHPAFWVWTVAYFLTPFLVPLLWLRNRGEDPCTPDPDDAIVPTPVRMIMGAIGAIALALGLLMFVWPELVIGVWPWRVTPLTTRVISGWIALAGALGVAAARETRWSAMRLGLHTGAIASALTFVGILRAWNDFDKANPLTWVVVAYVGLTVVAIVVLCISMEARRNRDPA
jgi:hypothetical protein